MFLFGLSGVMSGFTFSRRMIVALATRVTLAFLREVVFWVSALDTDALLLGIADGEPCNAAAMNINKLITHKNGNYPLNHRILTMITKRKITLMIRRMALTITMPQIWTFSFARLIRLLGLNINQME